MLAALVLGLLAPSLAWAQLQPPPQPNFLNSISVADSEPGKAHVVLTFAPAAPKFSVIVNDSDRTAIGFALSSRAPVLKMPTNLHGLLRAIVTEQQDTVMIIRLATSSKAKLTATTVGEQVITLDLDAGKVAAAKADQGPAGPLPKSAQRPPGEDEFALVPLKYADVSEVVGLLTEGLTVKPNDSFTPHEPAFGSAGMGGGANYVPSPSPSNEPSEPMAQSVDDTIAIDRRLNAVVLKGSPETIERLKRKIAEIDVPVQSVILETVFVELSESGARNVGLDFNNANGQLGVATYATGAFIPPGFAIEHGLSSTAVQAAIYAQVRAGHGRIVSKPRIAAQSGSSAKIITGDALPILTAITLSGVNGVSQQVQYVNVGVTLQIAPRVSSDGFVTSHVFCVVSSVTGFSQGYPTISQREAETSATVADGETFVIGGLTEENELSTRDKVPLAGDVPLVGQLFRLHKGSQTKTELYIVVTPHIVRRAEQAPPAP
jgi:general secretion pathway protein D